MVESDGQWKMCFLCNAEELGTTVLGRVVDFRGYRIVYSSAVSTVNAHWLCERCRLRHALCVYGVGSSRFRLRIKKRGTPNSHHVRTRV